MAGNRAAFAAVLASSALVAACGEGFSAGDGGGGAPSSAGSKSVAGSASGGMLASGGDDAGNEPGGGEPSGGGGEPNGAVCVKDEDCAAAASSCVQTPCVDGACTSTPLPVDTPCDGGACDDAGTCVTSTCSSGAQDGDETGKDCGGSCGLCPDGEGCVAATDCLSGVCTESQCKASACTDKVRNGSETGVDCGGSCALKCAQGKGCKVTSDCAVAAGDLTESVRCVDATCVSTKPPSSGGVPIFWQDFAPQRLVKSTIDCGAVDDVCLLGNGAGYQMFGIGTTGATRPLTKELMFSNEGAVGSGGKFDGTLCLTRTATGLTLSDRGVFTVMAWVKSTRNKAPWEGVLLASPAHYALAVDANPASQRFLAAISTAQSTAFDYRSATATNQIVTGQWHHVAQTYDTAAAKMSQYVDGNLVQTTAVSGNVNSAAGGVFMGCRKAASYDQFFIGTLDEVAVYTRALTEAELLDYVTRTRP